MSDLKSVIDLVISMFNTRLTFSPFSFTLLEVEVALAALSIVISFLRHVFDESS